MRAQCFPLFLRMKYFQFAPSVLPMHSSHEHVDTLAQATVLCPPFKVVFRPQGDNKGYRGRQGTGRFYWRFLFCSGKPEGKDRSGGERSNPLSYAGLNKMPVSKRS